MGDDMDEWEAAHAAELELEREMYPGMLKKAVFLSVTKCYHLNITTI